MTSIARNIETILQIAHGVHWNNVLQRFIEKLRDGKVGHIYPAHTKRMMDETWEACSLALRDDDNIVSLNIEGSVKSYNMMEVREVVEMVGDHFSSIRETDFASKERYLSDQKERED